MKAKILMLLFFFAELLFLCFLCEFKTDLCIALLSICVYSCYNTILFFKKNEYYYSDVLPHGYGPNDSVKERRKSFSIDILRMQFFAFLIIVLYFKD
jgi:hypothetical protein